MTAIKKLYDAANVALMLLMMKQQKAFLNLIGRISYETLSPK